MNPRIGVMQGRLSPLVEGKIQAFPWAHWEAEFSSAPATGVSCLEWTLDHDRLAENPLMTAPGRARSKALSREHGVEVPSLTADFAMQAPFWKAEEPERAALLAVFNDVVAACGALGIGIMVVPLVDNGALGTDGERQLLESALLDLTPRLAQLGVRIAFESDFAPARLANFIDGFPAAQFGINFDSGNSASLGWDPAEEIALLGPRILNVHIKDRLRGGTTVPLGAGAADLPRVFTRLREAGYAGRYILQTARAADGEHVETIRRYVTFVAQQLGGPCGS